MGFFVKEFDFLDHLNFDSIVSLNGKLTHVLPYLRIRDISEWRLKQQLNTDTRQIWVLLNNLIQHPLLVVCNLKGLIRDLYRYLADSSAVLIR